jgi:hypothetical protein
MSDPNNSEPDPRTARDDDEDATNEGVSASEPAEGADTGANSGSPG